MFIVLPADLLHVNPPDEYHEFGGMQSAMAYSSQSVAVHGSSPR